MARGKGNRKGASNDDLFDSDNDALDAVSESQSSATPTTSNTTETSKKPNRRKKVADVATSKPNHTSDTRKSNAEEDFDARSQLEDEQSGNTEPQDAIAAPSKKPKKKEKKRDKKEFSVPDMDFDLNLSEEAPAASNSLKSKSKKLQPMSFELLAEMESPPDTHEETKVVEVVEEFDFSIKKKKKSKGGGGGGGVEIENAGTSVVDATALEFAKSQDKKEKRGKLSKHEGGDSHSRDLPLDFKLKSRESKEDRTVERVESVDGSLNDKLADESASPSKRENTSPPTSSQPALAKHSAITPGTKSRKQQSRAQTPHSTSADEIIDEKLSKQLQTHVTLSSTPTSASTTPTSASSTPKLPKNGPTTSAPLKKTSDTYVDTDYQEMQKKIHKPTEVSNLGDSITATGILLSHERSKDIQVDKFSLSAFGQSLITDTSLNLLFGRRYGLVGDNGSGKSTLLKCLARREIQIQSNLNIYLLEKEYDPTELTAVEAVVDIILAEKITLEQESDRLLETMDGTGSARFEEVQDRLMELDIPMAEQKARSVLHGLGFTAAMQDTETREFSGGWRMRVALARALFVRPTCLLLDDATNHLDLSAVVWLETYLLSYPNTIIMVSHSQDFLNTICTDILYLSNKKLSSFPGSFDTFIKVKAELDENARKKFRADEKKIQKIKENLGRTGTQAKQARTHEKALNKRLEKDADKASSSLGAAVAADGAFDAPRELAFKFLECGGGLPSPFLKFNDVTFGYENRPLLYHNLNFGIDLKSRIALVGPNGAGKSTLMKLMCCDLDPISGSVNKHHHLRIARFHQHLTDQLELSMTAVAWLCRAFNRKPQEMRDFVGKFGLHGKSQTIPMEQLSDGQKRRVVFAWLSLKNAHLLMLDEPTNHLDIETIDALAEAIRAFDGGVVLISHDFRLINQVAEEIWIVEDGTMDAWPGSIGDYKQFLKTELQKPLA